MDEYQLAGKIPRRLDQHRCARGGGERVAARYLVPTRVVAECVGLGFGAVADVDGETHLNVTTLVVEHARSGQRVDETRLPAFESADDRDPPALGTQTVFVRRRIETGRLGRRRAFASRFGIERHPRVASARSSGPSASVRRRGARSPSRAASSCAIVATRSAIPST